MQTARGNKWLVPLGSLVMGFVFLGAFWVAGTPVAGLGPFVIMVGYGVLLLVGGRSEIVRVLRGQPSDEMWKSFDIRASLFAFFVLVAVLLGVAVYEMARGQDAQPYARLCLVGAVAYVAGLVWFRLRG